MATLWAASLCVSMSTASTTCATDWWTTAYYPAYRQAQMTPSEIDFSVVTHVIHFSVAPKPDGTLDTDANGLSPAYATDLVAHAHAAHRQALLCVGGANSQAGFQGATSATNLPGFVTRLVSFMTVNGYDGLDLDWEPLTTADGPRFTSLVNALRPALDQAIPRPLLTAATATEPALFGSLQDQFDQINVMTYDLAGPYPGWITWFNAPIFDGGTRFPSTGALLPSADGLLASFLAKGVPSEKLALGIAFYGQLWTHGTGTSTGGTLRPRQSWTTAPTVTPVAYRQIQSDYFQSAAYHYDEAAQSAYLSLPGATDLQDVFLAYDDERTCGAKVSYARNHHLGGVMIWELSHAYRANPPSGPKDPLLAAVQQALATPGATTVQLRNGGVEFSFAVAPLGTYQVQWSDDLTTNAWTPLTTYSATTNGIVRFTDVTVGTVTAPRYYRIQTPP